jgi:TRAP-type C4-dicarboxylate transport system substrate-binding protein
MRSLRRFLGFGLQRMDLIPQGGIDKMKKMSLLLLAACLVLLPCFSLTASAETITLTLSDQNSDVSWGPVHATQPWVKQVEKATNGRVKIQIYPSETLAKGKQNWMAAKSGICDMSWNVMSYYPGMAPYSDVVLLPGLPFRTGEKGSEVIWKLFEKFPELSGQFAENKVLILYTSTPFILMTAKKQVKTLEDLRGMKIRTVGGPPVEQMKALGGYPILLPMPDVYIAMQKGTIDGLEAAYEPIPGFRLYEVAKYITEGPFSPSLFGVVMNKKKWDSLPKDIQDAIMSVSGLQGSEFFGLNFFDSAKEPIKKMIEEGKYDMKIYTLPEAERAKWVDVGCKPIWDAWVKDMESKGYTKAREILDAAIELSK